MRLRAAATLSLVLAAGCAGSDADDEPGPQPERSANERLVRAWSAALGRDDFRAAAALFARGALIQQTRTFRLRTSGPRSPSTCRCPAAARSRACATRRTARSPRFRSARAEACRWRPATRWFTCASARVTASSWSGASFPRRALRRASPPERLHFLCMRILATALALLALGPHSGAGAAAGALRVEPRQGARHRDRRHALGPAARGDAGRARSQPGAARPPGLRAPLEARVRTGRR